MYLRVQDQAGPVLLHKDLPAKPTSFLDAVQTFKNGLVVAFERAFAWYWLADLCEREQVPFVLDHALEVRIIQGTRTKNDRVDSEKIAHLLRSQLLPQACVYAAEMRPTRVLLRRAYLVRHRAELLAHLQIINAQYHHIPFTKTLAYAVNRQAVLDRLDDQSVRKTVAAASASLTISIAKSPGWSCS